MICNFMIFSESVDSGAYSSSYIHYLYGRMIMPRYNEVRQVFYIIMYMTVYWEWQILVKWFHSHLSQ